MSAPLVHSVADVVQRVRGAVESGEKPVLWPIGPGELGRVEFGPGRVVLLGGAPGSGKTALALQATVDVLRTQTAVRALVANVEMGAEALVNRALARLSGISLDRIRRRALDPGDETRFADGVATLETLEDRLGFMLGPFTLDRLADAADAMAANLLVVDYVQRFKGTGDAREARQNVAEVMDSIRAFATAGAGVLALAALARTRGSGGSTYEVSDPLAAFRDSSELEYGADEAFILERASPETGEVATLRHGKCRDGELRDVQLRFHGACQAFESVLPASAMPADGAAP
jgi:replicative DNA helicase